MMRYAYLFGGAIGDATLGIHIGRVLSANEANARIEIISTRPNAFVRDLVEHLSFVSYRELPKHSVRSWIALFGLFVHSYKTIVYEPVTSVMPLWWRLILWCARAGKNSISVQFQMKGHERPVPTHVLARTFSCEEKTFFDTAPTVLEAWGVDAHYIPSPTLNSFPSPISKSYILFHFFAGHFRRSIPVDHARAILTEARRLYPSYLFVLTCMKSEESYARRMIRDIPNIQLECDRDAPYLLGLLSGAALVVGTASGILLIASHLKMPVIALSCLIYPCWLPTFNTRTSILAAYDQCRCRNNPNHCIEPTPEGDVFRCLFFIPTIEVIEAMKAQLPAHTYV